VVTIIEIYSVKPATQVVLEVHDTEEGSTEGGAGDLGSGGGSGGSRLEQVLSLLSAQGYTTSVRSAGSALSGVGYLSVLPAALRLFYVYAHRMA
jgi:hypothetical protein